MFFQEIDQSIVWAQVSPWVEEPINTNEADVRGYELSLALSLFEYLRLSANHTGLDATKRTTGQGLPGRTNAETNFRARLGPPEVFKLIGELQYTGQIPVSEGGKLLLPARSVWNVSASANLSHVPRLGLDRVFGSLWLVLAVNNVADVAVRDALFFPQPGRNARVGLEARW